MKIIDIEQIKKSKRFMRTPNPCIWIWRDGTYSIESIDTIPHPQSEKPIAIIKF